MPGMTFSNSSAIRRCPKSFGCAAVQQDLRIRMLLGVLRQDSIHVHQGHLLAFRQGPHSGHIVLQHDVVSVHGAGVIGRFARRTLPPLPHPAPTPG